LRLINILAANFIISMKKIIPALLCIVLFAGCKKDNQANVLGKWTLKKTSFVTVVNSQVIYQRDTTYSTNDYYLQLNADKSGTSNIYEGYYAYNSIITGPFKYVYDGSTLIFTYNKYTSNGYLSSVGKTITSFDDNNLVLHYQTTDKVFAAHLEGKFYEDASNNSYYIVDQYYSR
jgi:hypothetical protein